MDLSPNDGNANWVESEIRCVEQWHPLFLRRHVRHRTFETKEGLHC